MNDKKNAGENLDEATVIVSAKDLDDATIVVSKKQLEAELAAAATSDLDDATIVVSKKQLEDELAAAEAQNLDDATIVVSKKQLEAELAAASALNIDEATTVVGGFNALEEATIVTSEVLNESTTTAPNGGVNSPRFGVTTNSFETIDSAPSTRPITTIPSVADEPDAAIVVEDYVDPDIANREVKERKLKPETDEMHERLSGGGPAVRTAGNTIHEASERLRAMEKPVKSRSRVAIGVSILGALAIGILVAILILQL
jgi:hypothetical protein